MSKFTLMADDPIPPKKPNTRLFGFIIFSIVIGVYALIIFEPQLVYEIHDYIWER